MNDEFMHQLYEVPRPEFTDALYERISRQPPSRFAQAALKKLTFRNAVVALAFFFFIAACVYAVSEKRWNKVGDIWVDVQRAPKQSLGIQSNLWKGPAGDMEVENLTEAKSALDFEFAFPTWTPDGFVLDDQMYISPWSEKTLSASWKSRDGGDPIGIFLNYRWFWIAATGKPMHESISTWPVAPGSFKEVQVSGSPAVLVRGDWNWHLRPVEDAEDMELEWNEQNGLSLYWTDGEVAYLLWTYNSAVSPKDLIKMAESTQ